MLDEETQTLWSHILGKGMEGELIGTELEVIPAEMVTWNKWLSQHPETTVLNLSRTHESYTADFYRNPENFAFGWTSAGQAYSVSFDVLLDNPVLNLTIDGWPIVVTFDAESTSAHLFSRRIDGKELYFSSAAENLMSDEETGSVWNQYTGLAIEGAYKGRELEHQPAIVSYSGAWDYFHPTSIRITKADDIGK